MKTSIATWLFLWSSMLNGLLLVAGEEGSFRFDPIFDKASLSDNCDTYLAPSKIGGWGVYAGRDFDQGEIVEIAPRYLPQKSALLHKSVLDDYHYGFTFLNHPSDTSYGAVIFGMGMFLNHGPGEKQNVIYTGIGHEPSRDMPWSSYALTWVTNRAIGRGEELLCTYGETDRWFLDRGISMVDQPERKFPTLAEMEDMEKQYCSKVVAGIGQSTWNHRVAPAQLQANFGLPVLNIGTMLPLQNHPTAIAKQFVASGETLEISPALVVPKEQMVSTSLSPMSIYWEDLDEEQRETIEALRQMGAFRMNGVVNDTYGLDVLEFFDDATILPAAGKIALVKKVGSSNPNCKLVILPAYEQAEELDMGSAGLVLKLVATKDIYSGEELRLDLQDNSSWRAKVMLQQQLALLGQPIPIHIVDTYNPDPVIETEENPQVEPEL